VVPHHGASRSHEGGERGSPLIRLPSTLPHVLIAAISDTHLPRGQRRLPDSCVERLARADLILHAGDISTREVLADIEAIGPPVKAVRGNVDSPELRNSLPEAIEITTEDGARIAMVHDAGPSKRRLERLRKRFPNAAAVIFGHSHIPLHESSEDGFQIFNPGSPTDRRRQPRHTMGVARSNGGAVTFEHVTLD
jgi:putative phosphoesterase